MASLAIMTFIMMALATAGAFNPNGVWFDRLIIVLFENEQELVTHANPYFSNVEQSGRLLTNYSAITHPSQPNYISLVAGDTFGISDDDTHNLNQSNLVDLLERKSVSWKVYAENLGSNCNKAPSYPPSATGCGSSYVNGTYKGYYVRKHNPLMSLTDISTNASRCSNIVDAAAHFDADVAANAVPQFVMCIPTLALFPERTLDAPDVPQCNDGHDTGLTYAGKYLSWLLDHKMKGNAVSGSTLLLLVFDEGDSASNKVWATLVPGQGVPKKANASAIITPGSTSSKEFTHYSTLRTVEENWGLGSLGRHDASAISWL